MSTKIEIAPDMQKKNYSQVTHVGLLRKNNEDAVLCNPKLGLWLIADGMGGHAAGEVASELSKTVIEQKVGEGHSLAESINAAHHAVLAAAQKGEGKYGMGSTVVAMKSQSDELEIAWVGDSRAYLWSQDHLHALTTDHSYVQMLYQSGLISADELVNHPEKNIITQCIGSTELAELRVDTVSHHWQVNEWILLCSDGLTDGVNDQNICDILHSCESPEQAVQSLLEAALASGGRDNISLIVVAKPEGLSKRIRSTLQTLLRN